MTARSLPVTILLACLAPLAAQDADGDGLPDTQEAALGTPADRAETLRTIIDDGPESAARRAQPTYFAGQDIVDVSCGHVAEDRFLWRVTFQGEPDLASTTLHCYVDADADPRTGRQSAGAAQGTEYMLTITGGAARVTAFAPDGSPGKPVPLRFAVVGQAVWITADLPLKRGDAGLSFNLYLLCHTNTASPPMSDTTAEVSVTGLPIRAGEKIVRPADRSDNWRVSATYGLDLIRKAIADPANTFVEPDQLTLDGYAMDLFTQRRYGHLKMDRQGAKASAHPPRAGRYHVGFLMYDDGDDEKIAIHVNDELAGLAVSNRSNNRHWLSWLTDARDLKPTDTITLEAVGASGKHPVAGLIFMPKPPETRDINYTVDNLKWLAPVGTSGEVWLSWTTSWPSSTRFEYQTDGQPVRIVTEDVNRLVHKARLKGLPAEATFRGRGVGTKPDGTAYNGPWVEFNAAGAPRPQTISGTRSVPLQIQNPLDVDAVNWPVTGGVPFPKGTLGSGDDLRLVQAGQEIPIQVEETGTWPDGSLKWVLLTLLADVPAGQTAIYELQYGRGLTRAAQPAAIEPGWLPHSTVQLAGSQPAALTAAPPAPEVAGPLRAVFVSDETAPEGVPVAIQRRTTAYAGSGLTRIQYTMTVTGDTEFTDLDALRLEFAIPRSGKYRAETADGGLVDVPSSGPPLCQRFDTEYAVGVNAADGRRGRLTGTVYGPEHFLAVKDGWANYPLGFRDDDGALRIDLLPDFEPGLYDLFPFEKEGHHLYFHLRDGRYRLKRGMSKTWEIGVYRGDGSARDRAAAKLFQHPLVLQSPNEWNCASGAFYAVHPRDEARFKAYEDSADRNVANYLAARERQHDYGFINYGDWYGERGANWGNIEYDTQNAFFLEFVRSGNLEAFKLGHLAEIHNRDVDTVHWSPNPHEVGAVYVHQMGHVGGYYTESVPGTLGIPKAGYTVSHAWTEGHFSHFFLTGDRRSWDTGKAVVDYFVDKSLSRPYDWESAREPGWALIMNAAALAATNDPYYLNASRIIVDRVLETQETEPRPLPRYQAEQDHREYQVGGWSRMMVPGHCLCEPRHRGNAGFMVSILLSGLTYYHDVTGEPAVKDAIIRGANYLMDECYSPAVHGFRYTSCPKMGYRPGASPLMLEGIARAYRWTKDARFIDPLTEALALDSEGAAYGKSFSQYYRAAPRLLSDLAATGLGLLEPKKPETAKFVMPDWLQKLPADRKIVIQAEDFSGQGGGTVEVATGRQEVWGTMITKWHADEGHWLQWAFEVPKAGEYEIRLRYASGGTKPLRKVDLDGQTVAAAVEFEPTGGFATAPGQWSWRTVAEGVALRAGRHVLRLTNLGDGMGLDCVVLVREGG